MGIPELAVLAFGLLSLIVIVWPIARICGRIGFSPWFGLLALVPFGNVVLLWVLAYVRWPIDGSTIANRTERRTA